MATLSRLQIYLFVPVFLFYYVYTSRLSATQIAGIAAATLLAQFLLAVPLWLMLARRPVRREGFAVVLLSSVIFNAGNFGVPVAVRAYGQAGAAVQALVVMAANLSLWAIGYGLMATVTGRGPRSAIVGYLKLPMAYTLIAAFALRGLGVPLPGPVLYGVQTVANGLVPLALVTLGAQLASQARWPRWRVVLPVAALKLIVLPLVTALVVCLMHLWPWPGAMLVVASAGPTAVNTLLLTIEQKGDVELAADCVFWTTLLSAVTVTLALAVVTALGGHPPGR
jgi:predicted permease